MGNVARRINRGVGHTAHRGARPRLTRPERRDQLLDAAAELVADRGVGAITMEGVAAAAGVSKALPYTHFDDAHDLLEALRDREIDILSRRVEQAIAETTGFEAQIEAMVHTAFATAIERGGILTTLVFALPMTNVSTPPVDEGPSQMALFLESELGLPLPVARVAASIVILGLTGALLSVASGIISREAAEAVYARMVIAGVAAVNDDVAAGRLPA